MKGFISKYRGITLNVSDGGAGSANELDNNIFRFIQKEGCEPESFDVSPTCYAELWASNSIDYLPIIN